MNTPQKHIVILYTELAAYTIACLEALSAKDILVHVFHYPVNKEAPFKFNTTNKNIVFYNKQAYTKFQLLDAILAISPEIIYCSGWNDNSYLYAIRKINKSIKTILGFDNKWFGNLKQQLSVLYARMYITPYFNYAFVPGNSQTVFAQKLGFNNATIIKGVYSADVELFNSIYKKQLTHKTEHLPHRFIYIGRYYDFKGIKEMWQAFIEWQEEKPNDWELWCLGTGDVEPIQHQKIKHFGFVQPAELENYLYQTSVFILPSKFEPWGVVVHEMAAAGFPMLLSKDIGAHEQFLIDNKNGCLFDSGSIFSIKKSFENMAKKTDEELLSMGHSSHHLAQSITPTIWANRILELI